MVLKANHRPRSVCQPHPAWSHIEFTGVPGVSLVFAGVVCEACDEPILKVWLVLCAHLVTALPIVATADTPNVTQRHRM